MYLSVQQRKTWVKRNADKEAQVKRKVKVWKKKRKNWTYIEKDCEGFAHRNYVCVSPKITLTFFIVISAFRLVLFILVFKSYLYMLFRYHGRFGLDNSCLCPNFNSYSLMQLTTYLNESTGYDFCSVWIVQLPDIWKSKLIARHENKNSTFVKQQLTAMLCLYHVTHGQQSCVSSLGDPYSMWNSVDSF